MKRVVARIKAANYTNEPQATMVWILTGLNLATLFRIQGVPPWWFIQIALLFWPTFAFFFNLLEPIPQPKKQHALTEIPSKTISKES